MTAFVLLALSDPQTTPNLLTKAKLICDTSAWQHYGWLNSNELLYAKGHRVSDPTMKLDIRTGKSTTWNLKDRGQDLALSGRIPSASPDGKYLFWTDYKKGAPTFVVTDNIGSLVGSWPVHAYPRTLSSLTEEFSTASWSADSRSIAESVVRSRSDGHVDVWRRDVIDLGREVKYPILPSPQRYIEWCGAVDDGAGRLIWPAAPKYSKSGASSILSWNPTAPMSLSKKSIQWPFAYDVSDYVLSPDAKNILWVLTYGYQKHVDFVVTNSKGTNFRNLGLITFDPKKNQIGKLGGERWIPGRKAISFMWLDKLYEIDVP